MHHWQRKRRGDHWLEEAHTYDLGDGAAWHAAPQKTVQGRVAQGAHGDRSGIQDSPMHAAFMRQRSR